MNTQPSVLSYLPATTAVANSIGLYIHIPFCAKKCPYCDFNTYAGLDTLFQEYVDALCQELAYWANRLQNRVVSTIFLGGGTPTVLEIRQLAQLFETVFRQFRLAESCEITSEANPGTVDQAKFAGLRALGVNRLSMGVQSFQPNELQFLGRIHSVADVDRAYETARHAGFTNINLDFIFGLPHQSLTNWQTSLTRALAMEPEHLSLYSLIVEPNTPLHHWVQIGRVDAPDEDEAATHYEVAMKLMADAGYSHYEISNWARDEKKERQIKQELEHGSSIPGLACQHNLIYWRNQEYLGVGPGAHSHLHLLDESGQQVEYRWGNHKPVPGYIKRMQANESVVEFQERISRKLAMGETLMLGLRLIPEGVSFARFKAVHSCDLHQVFAKELAQFHDWGLLELDEERVRLTREGLMVGNRIFAAFLPDSD